MPKMNEVVAVVSGRKGRTEGTLTKTYHKLQVADLFKGIARTYRPKDDDGDELPQESKRVQYRVGTAIEEVTTALADLFGVVATQDYGNCLAKADVVVDGKVLMAAVPVPHLLFLEKQLIDLHTFVGKLPTLDPAYDWEVNEAADCYATPATDTTRTKKVPRNHVKAEATKEHPAQVDVYSEDIVIGFWTKVDFSGAIPEAKRNTMLRRVERLQDALKQARETANGTEVQWEKGAASLLEYVFER